MKIYLLVTIALVLTSVASKAQRQKPGGAPIEVGSKLADVTAYLEDGSAYSLREKLKGKHAVLVFGCLT